MIVRDARRFKNIRRNYIYTLLFFVLISPIRFSPNCRAGQSILHFRKTRRDTQMLERRASQVANRTNPSINLNPYVNRPFDMLSFSNNSPSFLALCKKL